MHLDDTDDDDLVHYVMLRAVDRFRLEFNQFPGAEPDSMEPDISKLKVILRDPTRQISSQVISLLICCSCRLV